MSRWLATSHGWADRTLRILVSPGPLSFAERRSVLQVLQQQGTIETFKMDPNYHTQFIAVAKTKEIADKLLDASPLSYTIASPHETLDINYIDLARPDLLDGTKVAIHSGDARSNESEDGHVHRKYELGIVKAEDFHHAFTSASSPLHGPWPELFTDRESLMSSILKQLLPHNMARPALAHWDYDLQHAVTASKRTERVQLARCLPSKMKKQMDQPDSDGPD